MRLFRTLLATATLTFLALLWSNAFWLSISFGALFGLWMLVRPIHADPATEAQSANPFDAAERRAQRALRQLNDYHTR